MPASTDSAAAALMPEALPPALAGWFRLRGWTPHPHQLAMIAAAGAGEDVLLIAPTGGGKTLAGFLPSLIQLMERPRHGLHTLYVSPLKALSVDIQRNVETPLAELRLPIRAETRTGDTPVAKRQRQRRDPPHLLMTTPESLALLLSYGDAADLFRGLAAIIIDEIHALAGTKRGDQLALCLARLARLAPGARRIGLSATVASPASLRAWLARDGRSAAAVRLVVGRAGAAAVMELHRTEERLPWAGHMALHAAAELYQRIRGARTTLVFVNTRAQAELVFQALWLHNADGLAIALHHGSLAVEQRRRVEAAMARGALRAVVATSSLDLGIDWGDIDLVVQMGAPKGVARMLQRIGRANHRLDEPSRALLVPGNRFEYLEALVAIQAAAAGELDGDPPGPGGLDVLAQHITGLACAGPLEPETLFAEITSAAPYAGLSRERFAAVFDFVATGGYALASYDRFRRLKEGEDGLWQLADGRVARAWRLNVGTIVEAVTVKVRLRNGPVLGEIEEYFVQMLTPGDSFVFAGQLLTFLGLRETTAMVAKGGQGDPRVPAYAGGRLPLSTHLARRVRALLEDPRAWAALPADVAQWLNLQRWRSTLPPASGLLVETFPRGERRQERWYMVAYCFEGRNAHQTLGMLLTRRMERAGLQPLGFVATDYVLGVWSLRPVADPDPLFEEDLLGDDLEAWMDESSMFRRTFRTVAVIAGLIERRQPGAEKSGRQVTVNSDLIYDVLRRHQPGHVLLEATRQDAARGLADVGRVAEMLARVKGRILHRRLDRPSPLSVPVLLEIGREQVSGGEADAALLAEAEASLLAEAVPELLAPEDAAAPRLPL